ncbi:biliverdin reductase A isoform X5 [Balearica regulorum gibbericeps]|uniref:biliverdin reductase A isoform X5 n=1 Tax=Balearica regulorum gibbericeps TaxID=100784 RepID=UPI003F640883
MLWSQLQRPNSPHYLTAQLPSPRSHQVAASGFTPTVSINKMFGTVVVGVGIAGLARIRDLMNPMPSSPSEHLKLFGFVSRRSFGSINEAKQISLEDALRSKEIHAAFISTENKTHEETIRMFLEAGKHVLVEYPMALSAKAAHELWEMAEQKDKVLHVEHIELLTEEYKQLKKEVAGKDLVKGTLHFTGSVLDENKTGFPAFSGIARLTWLIDLFGDLTVTSATREMQKDKNYSRMTVHFQTANQKSNDIEDLMGSTWRHNLFFHAIDALIICE